MFGWFYQRYFRLLAQIGAFFAANNYFHRGIYQGSLKNLCYPGLNCYACPLARFSCPMGSFQHFIAVREFPYFILGFLGIIGVSLGRFVCGWLCPFGFFQEILYKLKTFKIRISESHTYTKYIILFVLAILLPFITHDSWFCRLCPAGGLEAGVTQLSLDASLRGLVGGFFYLKYAIVVFAITSFVFIKRPFCRFGCPLGAIFGLFNKLTFFRIRVDMDKCTECRVCQMVCPMDIEIFKNPDSLDCIRCGRCIKDCPQDALSFFYGSEKEVALRSIEK
ncbi:4Fe-4S binding protein [candidate division WOR-3 bacterium]|nr:4Fe-4S binding protein [candidate division WOR-3 bacterium]